MRAVKIMGVLNITPDSFSDGGRFFDTDDAVRQAKKMVDERADIIDIGGESSRPGSDSISVEEEGRRVLPVIERLRSELEVKISIDTRKPEVARAALLAGADMINDISGFRDPEMIKLAAERQAPVVIMHMRGEPKTMQRDPRYDDVVDEIKDFLRERVQTLEDAGVEEIIVDPGIGFGKTLPHNLQILKNLRQFADLGYPVLIGASRKSFIGKITGAEVGERLPGTIAAGVVAIMNGASYLRVHDVAECRQAVQVIEAIWTNSS